MKEIPMNLICLKAQVNLERAVALLWYSRNEDDSYYRAIVWKDPTSLCVWSFRARGPIHKENLQQFLS